MDSLIIKAPNKTIVRMQATKEGSISVVSYPLSIMGGEHNIGSNRPAKAARVSRFFASFRHVAFAGGCTVR